MGTAPDFDDAAAVRVLSIADSKPKILISSQESSTRLTNRRT
jgi:hypothetical protein